MMEDIRLTYIKDVLCDNNIEVEIKDGKYYITGVYDAKNKEKLTYFYEMIRLESGLTIRNKLKHFLLEGSFEVEILIINQPSPYIVASKPSDYYGKFKLPYETILVNTYNI
jgi:hypothetical protein